MGRGKERGGQGSPGSWASRPSLEAAPRAPAQEAWWEQPPDTRAFRSALDLPILRSTLKKVSPLSRVTNTRPLACWPGLVWPLCEASVTPGGTVRGAGEMQPIGHTGQAPHSHRAGQEWWQRHSGQGSSAQCSGPDPRPSSWPVRSWAHGLTRQVARVCPAQWSHGRAAARDTWPIRVLGCGFSGAGEGAPVSAGALPPRSSL